MRIGDSVRVIAHRGASARAPENTVPSFLAAIDEHADGVELDARMTKDGAIVVMHSDDVSVTTNGTGRISEMELDEVRTLNAAARFRGWPESVQVPTLSEALVVLAGRVSMVLEVKGWIDADGYRSPLGTARAVASLVKSVPEVTISSFDAAAVAAAREVETGLRTALTCGRLFDPAWVLATAVEAGHAECHIPAESVDASFLAEAHSTGIEVLVWTVNNGEFAQELREMGVAAIFTDDPAAMRAALGPTR